MRVRFLAIGLIAGILAACSSGGADPKPTPSRSISAHTSSVTSSPASPTRTGPLTTGPNVRPGEKPPVYPDLAKQHNANGALAFAAYYFEAFDWGYATNDASLVENISLPSCTGCRKYVSALRRLHEAGGVLLNGRLRITSRVLKTGNFRYKSDYVAAITVNEQPVVTRAQGQAPQTVAPAVAGDESLVFVSWVGGSWKVVEVGPDR